MGEPIRDGLTMKLVLFKNLCIKIDKGGIFEKFIFEFEGGIKPFFLKPKQTKSKGLARSRANLHNC